MEKPTSKKEIKLDGKTVEILKKGTEQISNLQQQITPLQEKMQLVQQMINNVVSAVVYQNAVDPSKEGIFFSEDGSSIHVYDLEDKKPTNKKTKTKT